MKTHFLTSLAYHVLCDIMMTLPPRKIFSKIPNSHSFQMKPTLGDSVVYIENENKIQIVTTHYFGVFDHCESGYFSSLWLGETGPERDILSGPPLGPLLVLWSSNQKGTLLNRFYMP